MVYLHPALCSKPAACAAVELETGLRADARSTRSGNYLVVLVNPRAIANKPATTPAPQRPVFGQGPFGGNAA